MYGLVLSGGGSRGAYQAGVIKALYEIAVAKGISNPFQVFSGVSAGAINATFSACYAHDPEYAVEYGPNLWKNISANQVFRTDAVSLGKNSLAWISNLSFGALHHKQFSNYLLDTEPLWETLRSVLNFDMIESNIKNKIVHSLSVTATNYSTSHCINFVQSTDKINHWERTKRKSVEAKISLEHVMGSAAIPIFFPPIQIGNQYFGDGCLRNTAPVSPAIHLGAKKLIVVGVRKSDLVQKADDIPMDHTPSIAKIASTLLNAVFLDAIDIDIERMSRINRTIQKIPNHENSGLEPIEFIHIAPSKVLSDIALEHSSKMAKGLRNLLGGLGSLEDCSEILSYLLFDNEYCTELLNLGYSDTLDKRKEIELFFQDNQT